MKLLLSIPVISVESYNSDILFTMAISGKELEKIVTDHKQHARSFLCKDLIVYKISAIKETRGP